MFHAYAAHQNALLTRIPTKLEQMRSCSQVSASKKITSAMDKLVDHFVGDDRT
jgi:hypothetical protein